MAKKIKEIKDIREIKECPDCASPNLIYNGDRQQIICRECGLIYEPLAPDMEKKFESSHTAIPPGGEAPERIMIKLPEKKSKKKKAKKKAAKKSAKKPKKPAKKAAKKPAKKKAKKPAKKKAAKKPAKNPKKKGMMHHLRSRLKKKR